MVRTWFVTLAATCALIAPAAAQDATVAEVFDGCMANLTQDCVWELGNRIMAADSGVSDPLQSIDSLTACIRNPTETCIQNARDDLAEQAAARAANPVAAELRAMCLADPTPACLITAAAAFSSTAGVGSVYAQVIQQAIPFATNGSEVLVTQEWRMASDVAYNASGLSHMRWLLAQDQVPQARIYLDGATFDARTRASAAKLLVDQLASLGDFQGAFTLAETLYTADSDWPNRFELVLLLMQDYATAAPAEAPALIQQLPGTTDQGAGFAALAVTLSEAGDATGATTAFGQAMPLIDMNTDPSSRDSGLQFWAEELASVGAFDLARRAVEQMNGNLVRQWAAFKVAEEMFGADQQEAASAMLAELAPDNADYLYYELGLALARNDADAARDFADSLDGTYRSYAAQGLARALFETDRSAEAVETAKTYGFDFGDSPAYSSDIPVFAAILAADDRVDEAVALAAAADPAVGALAFAAIAVALNGEDWQEVVRLSALN